LSTYILEVQNIKSQCSPKKVDTSDINAEKIDNHSVTKQHTKVQGETI
jgi:hypothetical protein